MVSDADLPLASKRLALSSAVKRKRDAVEGGGCDTPVGRVDTDLRSQVKIHGAVTMAALAGDLYTVNWRMADNSVVPLSASEVTAMGVAVGQFIADCQARKNTLDAAIAAAETLAELDAIEVGEGWPG